MSAIDRRSALKLLALGLFAPGAMLAACSAKEAAPEGDAFGGERRRLERVLGHGTPAFSRGVTALCRFLREVSANLTRAAIRRGTQGF